MGSRKARRPPATDADREPSEADKNTGSFVATPSQPSSQSRRQRRVADATAAIALLAEIFPQAFFIYGARRKPLKLGIRDEIVARLDGAVEPPELALALCLYCRSIGYLRAMRPGAARIDLDGNPANYG